MCKGTAVPTAMACRRMRSASDPSASVLAVAEAYRARLQAFFRAPESTVDCDSLADFLCYPEGAEKRADPRPAEVRLVDGLAGVRFRRPAGADPIQSGHETTLLDSLLAQSDHQNLVTARFLGLLRLS
jgi:hypothetical protein